MIIARQSTALELAIGPVLDADGVAVTGCVVGDFKIKKTTGNFAALNGSATLTHVSAGMYDLVLTTSDTDTVGLGCIAIDDTTNACAPIYLQVIEEAVYDAMYAASALGYVANAPVNVAQISGSSTAADNAEVVFDTDFNTNYDTTANMPLVRLANAVDHGGSTARLRLGTADDVMPAFYVTTDSGNGTPAVTFQSTTGDGTGFAIEGSGGGYGISAQNNLFNVTSGTITTVFGNVGGSIGSLSTTAKGHVNTEVVAALAAINLDHLLTSAVDINFPNTVHTDSVIGHLAATGSGYDRTTDSLEAQRDNIGTAGAGLTAADDAVIAAIGALSIPSANAIATAVLTTAMTEDYRATGATGTVAELLYEIVAHMGNSGIAGTTKTLTKLDKSTTAKTYTLDDANNPTAIEETT